MLAASKGNLAIVKMLVNGGAELNLQDNLNADTALIMATRSKHIEGTYIIYSYKITWFYQILIVVEYLIAAGADTNIKNNLGKDALHYADAISEEMSLKFAKPIENPDTE